MQTLTPPEQLVCELCTLFDTNIDLSNQFNARYVARVKRVAYALRNNLPLPPEN